MRTIGWTASIILITLMVGLAGAQAPGAGIYVAEAGNHRIVRVNDISGAGWITRGSSGSGINQFNNPLGIFVDAAGRIYVADTCNDRIVRMNGMTGTDWTTLSTPLRPEQASKPLEGLSNPRGIFVDGAGRIYVADSGNSRIVRMNDITGAGWTALGIRGTGVYQFDNPSGIFVDGAGRIYVADSYNDRIVRMNDMMGMGWTTLGTPLRPEQINRPFMSFNDPVGIFVDGAGRIYVLDSGYNRVVRVDDMAGDGWTTFGGQSAGGDRLIGPHGIFVDEAGGIYVADNTRIVRVNDMKGTAWTTLSTPGINHAIFVR